MDLSLMKLQKLAPVSMDIIVIVYDIMRCVLRAIQHLR